jgi:molecular chaperone DnaK (HSP70)
LIDADGILNVTARDARTGKEHSVDVKPSYGLSEEQVEQMIRESFENAEEDMRERQAREARVEADNILAATHKAQRHEAWNPLSEQKRQEIEIAKRDLLAAYHRADHHAVREKLEALNRATMTLAESMMNTAVRGALKRTKLD